MTLIERLEMQLAARGVRIVTGRRARCLMSISVFTPAMLGRSAVVSVHPDIECPRRIAEALAIQLALLIQSGGVKRFRLTDANYRDGWLGRAWRQSARLSFGSDDWARAMAEHLDGPEIEERFGVTPRMVRLRWNLWVAKGGNLGPMLTDPVNPSLTLREPDHFWCEVV